MRMCLHQASRPGNARWPRSPADRPRQLSYFDTLATCHSLTLLTASARNPLERSSEVASLLEELYVRVLLREGEPTVLREAEEVLLLVVDKVRYLPLLAQRHLKPVKGLGPPATPLSVTAKHTHQPPNSLRQNPLERSAFSSLHNRRVSS